MDLVKTCSWNSFLQYHEIDTEKLVK